MEVECNIYLVFYGESDIGGVHITVYEGGVQVPWTLYF